MKKLPIILILILAAFLRLYTLSSVPPSASLDEASIGWNAYSILHTGHDEYGTKFPILLRAYDDWRPALYVYLTIPFVWLLGLTSVSVRLPSVLLSILTVYLTYEIGVLLGKKYLSFSRMGEIAALFLAVSPWHIYISRLGHEANIGLTLVVLGMYFLLRAVLIGEKRSLLISSLMFGLSAHGYQSEKIVSPLLILSSAFLFWKTVWKDKRTVILAVILCGLVALPAVLLSVSKEGLSRYQGTTAFSSDAPRVRDAAKQYTQARERGDRIGRLIHSRYVAYGEIFAENYLAHFSPAWVFTGERREAHKVPGIGLLYLWEIPFVLLGIYALFSKKISLTLRLLIACWILISPLPAAITTQAPHAMRSYTVLPGLQLLEALGFWIVMRKWPKNAGSILYGILVMCVLIGLVPFWTGYFNRFPKEQSDSFQYAMKDAVRYAVTEQNSYTSIQFSNQGNTYQSYMFYLYYSIFDPVRYGMLGGTKSGGYNESHVIGKYAFGFLPEETKKLEPHTLYFYDADLVPQGTIMKKTFTNVDGKPAIIAVTL